MRDVSGRPFRPNHCLQDIYEDLERVRDIWTHLLGIFSCKKPKSENCGIDANRICKLLQPRVTPATSLDPILI